MNAQKQPPKRLHQTLLRKRRSDRPEKTANSVRKEVAEFIARAKAADHRRRCGNDGCCDDDRSACRVGTRKPLSELSRETIEPEFDMLVGCKARHWRWRHHEPFAAPGDEPMSECAGEGAFEPVCVVLVGRSTRN